jgi:3-oxoacyl-[acyl-carrier protein] reductase
VAIVTGGANGIGREPALTFAHAGAAQAIWDMAKGSGQAVAAEIEAAGGQAAFFKVNVAVVTQGEAVLAAVVQRFGRVDVLINIAGILRDGQLVKVKDGQIAGKLSEADFDAVIAVNLKGVFDCTQAVAPSMIRQGFGRIINATSVVGLSGNFGQTN